MAWTSEETSILVEMAKKGHTVSDIAARLNKRAVEVCSKGTSENIVFRNGRPVQSAAFRAALADALLAVKDNGYQVTRHHRGDGVHYVLTSDGRPTRRLDEGELIKFAMELSVCNGVI